MAVECWYFRCLWGSIKGKSHTSSIRDCMVTNVTQGTHVPTALPVLLSENVKQEPKPHFSCSIRKRATSSSDPVLESSPFECQNQFSPCWGENLIRCIASISLICHRRKQSNLTCPDPRREVRTHGVALFSLVPRQAGFGPL